MTRCSVVIVSYHSSPILFATLRLCFMQEGVEEVLLVDNGNAPGVVARLQQTMLDEPRLKLISGHGNIGLAKACNLAVAQAAGEYILFLQPDCLLSPAGVSALMHVLADTPEAMVAAPWLLNPDGSEQVSGHAHVVTPRDGFAFHLRFGRPLLPSVFQPISPYAVPAVASSCLMIRKVDFERLGGFDPRYFLCVEDIDLCRRVKLAGRTVLRVPGVRAAHWHDSSGGKSSSFIDWQRLRGLMKYYTKHFTGIVPLPVIWMLHAVLLAHYAAGRVFGRGARRGPLPLSVASAQYLLQGVIAGDSGQSLAGRRVVLTGAMGTVGLCVLRRLVAEGAEVLALVRQAPPVFFHPRVEWVQADMDEALPPLSGQYDTWLHCAPLPLVPLHLARMAQLGCKRLVALGSTARFSRSTSRNWHEKTMSDALAIAEADIETMCGKQAIAWTILRPTVVYGGVRGGALGAVMRFIFTYGVFPFYAPGQGKRHPVHADDVAQAMLTVLEKPVTEGKAYNVSGAEVVSAEEMLRRCFIACGKRPRLIRVPLLPLLLDVAGKLLHKQEMNAELAYRMNEDLTFFHDAARDDFGYSPRGFSPVLES